MKSETLIQAIGDAAATFAEDELGNLFIIDLGGEIFRIDTASIPEPATGLVFIMLGVAGLRSRTRS